jgi:ribonuclease P protein component
MSDIPRPDERLPKKEILRKRDDIRDLFKSGKKYGATHLRFFYKHAELRQVGFTVPKRFGNAVHRNRIKRLMREAYRKNKHRLGPYKMVILAREDARSVKLKDLENELVHFIKNAGVSS